MDIEPILGMPPFSLDQNARRSFLEKYYNELTHYHYRYCADYRRILETLHYDPDQTYPVEALPFLPIGLFKTHRLVSVRDDGSLRTMTSSGTSGQQRSQIFLDRNTSINQTKVLHKITADFIGKTRLPMLIIDSEATVKDRKKFSARAAGIKGFSLLGRRPVYALDEHMQLDQGAVAAFMENLAGQGFFAFGFTAMIYQHFLQQFKVVFPGKALAGGVLIHGGGWKKLESLRVSRERFAEIVEDSTGIETVLNYYGMVEQTGSIYFECCHHRFHCSNYSDIFIRNSRFEILPIGEEGIVEVRSLLPLSYPGHMILTEDRGTLLGIDDCPCGRLGKTFAISGRIKNAEIRGCSDTYHTQQS